MRPTPTRLTRWGRVLAKSRDPIAKLTQDAQAVKLAAKGGRLTYAGDLLRDLRQLSAAFDAVEKSLLELGAHEERRSK